MKKKNFGNRGQGLVGIIIVLVVTGIIGGGLYYYFSKQTPEAPEIAEEPASIPTPTPTSTLTPTPTPTPPSTPSPPPTPPPLVQKCTDGTPYSQCSTNKPKYCEVGNLINKCSICGCSLGQSCNVDESCSLAKIRVNIMAYIQTGVAGVNETSYRNFIENINQLYSNNGINVDFNVGEIEWYDQSQSCGTNLYSNNVIMCVGQGKGGFLGVPYFTVGANTDSPFGFSSTGVMAEAHELAHFLGFQDLYWLRSQESLRAPTIFEVENDIMTSPYTLSNVFGEHAKYVLNLNLGRLKSGQSLIYPKSRMASGLKVDTGLPNQNCQIYTRQRDYSQFNSKVNNTPSLTKTTNGSGIFEMDIIGGDPADNNFDIYYIVCGLNKFWINSLATEDCFKAQGAISTCNIKCLNSGSWCQFDL